MKRSVMIHQPEYLPWTNLFLKMAAADIFVFLDTVQYVRRGFQNRNMIKTRTGKKWLTVPLIYAPREEAIMNMKIDNSRDWRRQHLDLIDGSYRSSGHYGEISSLLKPVYESGHEDLSGLDCMLTMEIASALGIKSKFMKASELEARGKRSELILNICLELGGARYISGIGAKAYLDERAFREKGIEIVYMPPARIEYEQAFPELGFMPDLSVIDYLFNRGIQDPMFRDARHAEETEVGQDA